jgi:hypothetical protein
VPRAVSTDHILFARVDAKAIRESALVTEVKQALEKEGMPELWNKLESESSRDLGVAVTDLDSATFCMTEMPAKGGPKFVAILVSSKPFDKTKAFRLGSKEKPDSRGFYKKGRDELIHFPDDKTVVMLHPDLAQKYLDGYAKDRNAWPLTSDLTAAASSHTIFAVMNVQKLPLNEIPPNATTEFGAFLKAQTVTITADLRGKQLNVGGRATFPDADSASKSKDIVQKYIGIATGEVENLLNAKGKESDDFISSDTVQPIIKEAHRALKEAKVEVSGSDLTLLGSYKADFDIPKLVADLVKKTKETGPRLQAQNNLKQIGIAFHNYHDTYGLLPIHGVGPKGVALKNPTDKPLLSWRVAILPYIGEGALYKEFKLDEPWDSEHNKKLITKMPAIYAGLGKPNKLGETHLQMVIGPSALRPGMRMPASFPDGTSNTIAVIEAANTVTWTKPDDVMLPGKEPSKDLKKKFGGQFPGGFNVLLWDGSVRWVRDSVSDRTLYQAITPAGGEVLGADW